MIRTDHALLEDTDAAAFTRELERRLDGGWQVLSFGLCPDGGAVRRWALLRRRAWQWPALRWPGRKAVTA